MVSGGYRHSTEYQQDKKNEPFKGIVTMVISVHGDNGNCQEWSGSEEHHIYPINVCFFFNLTLAHIKLEIPVLRTIVYTMSLKHEQETRSLNFSVS